MSRTTGVPAARRTTIAQVAQLAGVSKATVSKAFNNRGGVSAETRRRVLMAAESLGWRPSARAVALTSGGSGAVGFVINRAPDLLSSDPYFGELLSGIERTLAEHSYWLLLQIAEHTTPAQERDAYATLAQTQRIDGVFLVESRIMDQRFEVVDELNLPAVIVSRPWARTDIPWEGAADPGGGVADAVAHLAALGHRRVAYVAGPPDRSHVQYRTQAFLGAVAANGLSVLGIARTDFSAEEGHRATVELLGQRETPTAILYDSDPMAIAGCRAAHARGLRVPEDLSVIGHDDIHLSRWTTPALTTIQQDVQGLGERCAARLLGLLGVPVAAPGPLPDPVLVVRESTGPVG
ncbi:LacI family DNA-binding transcriptional regulator [Pseudonocardia sp. MH-G8]|uniref:LacI family DNA-binding transcriptional regulator n=1 Tax=Pseudonocardia sp. MH-G8 TaxID=1854588 RepID=UPI000BA17A90|nr:LacI family DNA-binding transcriptional regulator [Pseudonocardia sp. MH-G8]OZM75910.1 LacI family transcriptional regulator [Pseudonocardia sp. MH-G8]